MLELPESRAMAKQINETLAGKTVSGVIVEKSPHRFAFYSSLKDKYGEIFTGRAFSGAKQVGGLLELDFGEYMLYFSDGASPRFYKDGNLPPKHQLAVSFTDGSAFAVSVQMYGSLCAAPAGKTDHEYYVTAASKPDAIGDAFTYDYFRSLSKPDGKKMTLKAFLATEQRIPGLGNGVLQDILFNSGFDPRFDMKNMTEDGFKAVYKSVRETLKKMCGEGGRSTEKDFFGNPGGYRCVMCKDNLDKPCPKCGSPIEKASYMGGAVYFCPSCQSKGV